MKVWLCKFVGLLKPKVLSGPFKDRIPDEEVVKAVKGMIEETNLLFWIGIEVTLMAEKKFEFKPVMGTFFRGYMDDIRSKALE